ncbi:MAG: RelA/SpoT family protein, partial [Pseudomonadota bacterium]
MVKLREEFHHPTEDIIYPEIWFEHVAHNRSAADIEFLRSAFALAELAGEGHATFTGVPVIQNALAMADIVDNLQLDVETIAATLLYPCVEYADLAIADIAEQLGANIAKLIHDVKSMQAIRQFYLLSKQSLQSHSQIDNLRKMLLAMVDDIRVVLIKLAERVCTLRQLRHLDTTTQVDIAQETQEIYAPLANRLGIAQIKWELEDLSFRYLQAPIYKEIASQVAMKRSERESYIGKIINSIDEQLKDHSISHYQIDGRAKHIFSIYKKMQRKNIGFDKVFDVIAVRILVKDIESCYAVLSLVHLMWQPIAAEFDDYINHPKPNGYRSLHTAVIGPQNKNVEIQIRTFAMHDEAELGVAAHWIYKEGKQKKSTYNDKIAWLRQIMDWQKEISPEEQANQPDTLTKQLFNDRIYVFTPRSEILDLPAGATPLDFAYLVHTEIGHRCKGAKINDHIVPLTYQLKTGDKIEVLTAKFPNPSRDWLNANLGYVKTSRAKAKIHLWFKKQDYE